MPIKTQDYDEDEATGAYVLLKVRFTEKYPEEKPILEFEDELNLDELRGPMMEHLEKQIEDNMGMVMGFTIISEAVEFLGVKWEEYQVMLEERQQLEKEREEELEKKRLEGTKVTIESFLAWKAKFDEEQIASKKIKELALESSGEQRLTGKQMFLENVNMNLSDINFSAEETASASVEVDEALFNEDLDDLDDLEDSD